MTHLPNDPPLYFDLHVFCCTNRRDEGHERGSCAQKGAEKLKDYLKNRVRDLGLQRIRINQSGCLDRCEQGPCVLVYPDGVWYRCSTKEEMEEVLMRHLVEGGRAEHLMIDKPEQLIA